MRETYQDELDRISTQLVDMTNLVGSAMSRATTALLDADVDLAEKVITGDAVVDELKATVDDHCFEILARQQPVATDLRIVVTALAMNADLERMGDLAAHIAKVARMRFPEHAIPQEIRSTILEMGQIAQRIVAKAGSVIAGRDVERAAELEADDDVMDANHRELFRVLLSDDWPYGIETAIDVTLLGRYYERFADHAVSVARRVVYIVTGAMPERAAPPAASAST